MDIIEQLKCEVSERAGSPEGFLNLIRLIIQEIEKIDVTSPEAPAQYAALLRAYVLVKRQLAFFKRRAETFEIDRNVYDDTVRRLKYAIRVKRDEAREHAARTISPDKLKEIKRIVGTLRLSEYRTSFGRELYFDQTRSLGHSYNRMTS